MCKKEFYYEVLKRIKLRGENLENTAKRYAVHRSGLQRILQGDWKGTKAKFVLESLCKYLEIDPPEDLVGK